MFGKQKVKCDCCSEETFAPNEVCSDCFNEFFLDNLSPRTRAMKGMDEDSIRIIQQQIKEQTLPPDVSGYKILGPKPKGRPRRKKE